MPAVNPVGVDVVWVLLHKYVYAVVPPVAFTVAEPDVAPLQPIFVWLTISAINKVGSVMVALVTVVQPFASVTVTV